MAISLVQTKKPHFLVPLLAFITMFLALLSRVNAADSLSFTFNSFSPDEKDLILQGDAVISNNVLQLTTLENDQVGRALFYAPVRLWGKSAGEASFETTFKFEIAAPTNNAGDGLTFFIASPDTQIPPNSAGKLLGLFPGDTSLKNSSFSNKENYDFNDKIVAVEIDTYPNAVIDPNYRHIGIDVNSIVSKKTVGWVWQNGKVATANISYNSASQRLAAVVTYPSSSVPLEYDIVLSTFLPEWVRVGFSASTGASHQTNTILSWSFTSNFVDTSEEENMYIATVV